MKDRILVTGSAGFIGFHVCKELINSSLRIWIKYKNTLNQGKRLNKTGLGCSLELLPKYLGEKGEKLIMLTLSGHADYVYLKLWSVIENKLNIGRKRNICVEKASHPYLVLMDDDDYYQPGSVKYRIEQMIKNYTKLKE